MAGSRTEFDEWCRVHPTSCRRCLGSGECKHCFAPGREHFGTASTALQHVLLPGGPKCCDCYSRDDMLNTGRCPRCDGKKVDPEAAFFLSHAQVRRSMHECAICGYALPFRGWQGQDVCNKCSSDAAVIACVDCLEPVFKHHSMPVRPHQKGCRFRQDDGMGQEGKDRARGAE